MRFRFWCGVVGLSLILVIVVAITLTPTTVDAGYSSEIQWILHALHRVGVPESFGYHQLEFTANIVMFVPLGFFAGLITAPRWRALAIALPALSLCIELTQLLFLPGRVAAVSDVVANSLGGWVGLGVALVVVVRMNSPHRSAKPDANPPLHRTESR